VPSSGSSETRIYQSKRVCSTLSSAFRVIPQADPMSIPSLILGAGQFRARRAPRRGLSRIREAESTRWEISYASGIYSVEPASTPDPVRGEERATDDRVRPRFPLDEFSPSESRRRTRRRSRYCCLGVGSTRGDFRVDAWRASVAAACCGWVSGWGPQRRRSIDPLAETGAVSGERPLIARRIPEARHQTG